MVTSFGAVSRRKCVCITGNLVKPNKQDLRTAPAPCMDNMKLTVGFQALHHNGHDVFVVLVISFTGNMSTADKIMKRALVFTWEVHFVVMAD